MTTRLLLDTCAVLWVVGAGTLSAEATDAMDEALAAQESTYVSPISAWEIGMLAARGRMMLTMSPSAWFAAFSSRPGIALTNPSPEILIGSSFLPGSPPRDPSDRIVIATAREDGLTIITRDRLILDYAEAGHVRAIAC